MRTSKALMLIAIWLIALPALSALSPEERERVRLFIRDVVNEERARHGLGALEIDPLSTRIADAYCERQIREGVSGHFTLDGQSPYMRYSFAGGNDGLSENTAAWSANYVFPVTSLPSMIRESHDEMMREKPPYDGHRRAILDPAATHIGIGVALEGGEFRFAQEFIRRYLEWFRPAPRGASTGQTVTVRARPVEGYRVEAVAVHHEPPPRPITRKAATAMRTYSLPRNRRIQLPRLGTFTTREPDGSIVRREGRYEDGRQGDFTVEKDGTFACPIRFDDGPGIYTIVVWVRPDREGSTAIAASNVSVRVDRGATALNGQVLGR